MLEGSQYLHNFSNDLNFTMEMQKAIDEVIELSYQFYISFVSESIIRTKNDFDFHLSQNQRASIYLQSGLNLVYSCMHPLIVDMIMQNNYELIMENNKNNEILRLQLLYVRSAVKLFYVGDFEGYMCLYNQLGSNEVPKQMHDIFFEKKLKEKQRGCLEQ